jgi:alpha-beta hydrolase superfamily lysophospholipase
MATSALFFNALPTFIAQLPNAPQATRSHAATTNNTDLHTLTQSYLQHYNIHSITQRFSCTHYIWKTTIELPQQEHKTSPQAFRIVQQYWQAKHAAGTVVLAHGYFDHAGLYRRIIEWALKHHYNVLCFDLPGHGLSSGKPAAIDHFSSYTHIFNSVIKHANDAGLLVGPLYAIGQSTGCSVITDALLNHSKTLPALSHVILLAPLVRIRHWSILQYLYMLLAPLTRSIKRTFIPSSHDTEFNYFLQYKDPLQARRIPLSWIGAMHRWYKSIKQHAATTDHSQAISIIQGTADTTVDWRYNAKKLQQLFPNTHVHYISQARHHLVKESDEYWQAAEEVLKSILKTS